MNLQSILDPQINRDLKQYSRKQNPKRRELIEILGNELKGGLGSYLLGIPFLLILLIMLFVFFSFFPFTDINGNTEPFSVIFGIVWAGGVSLFFIFSVYFFYIKNIVKRTMILSFYITDDELIKEEISLGKFKTESWRLSEIDYLTILKYRYYPTSQITRYSIIINKKSGSYILGEEEILWETDKNGRKFMSELISKLVEEGIDLKEDELIDFDESSGSPSGISSTIRRRRRTNTTNEPTIVCQACNAINRFDSIFCTECGNTLKV